MFVDHLLDAFSQFADRTAIVWRDQAVTYESLASAVRRRQDELDIPPGTVVGLTADYSPASVATLIALLGRAAIVSPLSEGFDRQKDTFFELAQVQREVRIDRDDTVSVHEVGHTVDHPLLLELASRASPGLVLFSSGSSGRPKAVVHDGARLLARYASPRRANVTIPFMLFDHIGGINTLLHILSSGGTAVFASDRSPEAICSLIDRHRVQVLPTTPTFTNLLLLLDTSAYDLSSLSILAYGAERMSDAALKRLASAFPEVRLVQNYGMSEVGILRTKSEANDSLWVQLGGDGYETRVRDGMLEIKADTAMLGYLNEASPFTDDGWLKTGDRVETKGPYVRFLGRASDIIIVGGEKVYPAEVEDMILAMDGVLDVIVVAENNALTGQIVRADVRLRTAETRAAFRKRMTSFLEGRLAPFKVPQKLRLSDEPLHNARFKKSRT